ncbi:MAG: AAA family ATPase [Rikenellaceae bacterium]|nr:AAA family ATPase [Rikenellaceae bacterium]MCL2692068.1 AAA family ATPase [Rikenellaceae bacterium]
MAKIDFSKFRQWEPCQVNGEEPTLVERCLVDLQKGYPEIEYLLKKDGDGCVPRGDIQMIVGQQKSGKTFASMIFETALLSGKCMGFEAQQENLKILHVDTEQHINNVVDKNRKLLSLAGYPVEQNHERLNVLSIRELPPDQRLQVAEDAIVKFRPDFVLIDGIRDLCGNFNDIDQANHVINVIMKLSSEYKCAIMTIIHQNKDKNDNNPRGHLGTELMNKCSEGYYVTRSTGSPITVSQKICRNAPIRDWFFNIDDQGKPEIASAPLTQKELKTTEINESFRRVFSKHKELQYKDLMKEYIDISGYSDSTAKNHIREGFAAGILHKDGKYYSYLFPPYEEAIEE